MIRAVVTGVAGRMGSLLVRAVRDAEGFQLVGATEQPGTAAVGLDAGLAAGLGMLEVPVCDNLAKALQLSDGADVVIDFTNYKASVANAEICAEKKVDLVVGSTGFTPEARERIAKSAKVIPIVMSPNMSVGVNLMIRTAAELGQGASDRATTSRFCELHHRQKVDAPSGTALRLAEVLAETLGRDRVKDSVASRSGPIGERSREEIGIQSLRGRRGGRAHRLLLGRGRAHRADPPVDLARRFCHGCGAGRALAGRQATRPLLDAGRTGALRCASPACAPRGRSPAGILSPRRLPGAAAERREGPAPSIPPICSHPSRPPRWSRSRGTTPSTPRSSRTSYRESLSSS